VAELTCVTVVRNEAPTLPAVAAPRGGACCGPAEPDPRRAELRYEDIAVGHELPPLEAEPISRLTLALYCGASGDHNPIHVDLDFAREAGMDDVIAHGMLALAYVARQLTGWVPQQRLKRLQARFVAITHVGDRLTCRATVIEKLVGNEVKLALSVVDHSGIQKITGEAVVALA